MGIIKHLSAAAREKEFTLTRVGANGRDLSLGQFGNSTIGLIKTDDVQNFSRMALI